MSDIARHIAHWLAPVLLLASGPVLAWSNHAMGSWQALSSLTELKAVQPVQVERLETFLAAENGALERLLQQEEDWARAHVPLYPVRPDAIAFRSAGDPAQLRQRFVHAVRINPGLPLKLFLQLRPGELSADRPSLPWTEVTTLRRETSAREANYQELVEGERVAVQDVLATASDEPDYGMDIGLWENNDTAYGRIYGFGKQPFGNPALEFASQAPFHMGFYHEASIVYLAAGFLKRTYPEYRIHLWQTLARHALQSGHPYWGWRFAGWALHYLQDLNQPYHARVLPGVSVPRMLWINSVDLLGFHTAKNQAITLVSNRHLALENYQYHRMRAAYLRRDMDDALLSACKDPSRDASFAPYADSTPRQVITRQANDAADSTDRTLEMSLPGQYIADPGYDFGKTAVNLFAELEQSPPAGRRAMTRLTAGLLGNFGVHTRSFLRPLLTP